MSKPGPPADAPFPLVLAHHHAERSTGTLLVLSPPFRKKVYLQEGGVVFAASDDRNDRLGEMLLRRGVLRIVPFLTASAALQKGKRFGTLLVERGLLSPEQLVWAVKEQVKEIVFSLFSTTAAACEYVPGGAAGEEIITLTLNTYELLRLGIERLDRISAALEPFRDPRERFSLRQGPESVARLLRVDERAGVILTRLARPVALENLFENPALTDLETLKLMWTLWVLDLLEAAPPSEATAMENEELGITADDLTGI